MLKSGWFHSVLRGFLLPHPDAIFPLLPQSGKVHSNVHVVFTELVLGSFPEKTISPTYRCGNDYWLKLAHILLHKTG